MADDPGEAQEYGHNNGSQQANGVDVEALEEQDDHDLTEDSIVVISSDHDESGSTLSPVPSEYDGSCSPMSTSSDGRNASVDRAVLDEDLDIGDYNDPPRSASANSQTVVDSELGGCADETGNAKSCVGSRRSVSAVEGLRAIQAALIPGYEKEDDRNEQYVRVRERSDL